jgi:hypothetical protein
VFVRYIFVPNKYLASYLSSTDFKNKKFYEELFAYFPLKRHGPHIKNAYKISSGVACVFVVAITFLPSRCLATLGEYVYSLTE